MVWPSIRSSKVSLGTNFVQYLYHPQGCRNMEVVSPEWNDIGPIDLLYSGAEHVFNLTQGSIHLDKVSDFVESVRWNEPFIRALLSFQVLLFLLTYITRKRDLIQFSILLLATVLALFAERLNEYGREHWPEFASQNYFDRSGLFLSVFLSGPFVILANFIVIGMATRLIRLYARKQRCDLLRRQSKKNHSLKPESKKET